MTDAIVGTFWDSDSTGSQGALPDELSLGGFKYERFKSSLGVEKRLDWVARSQRHGFIPNVYVQLSHVLREMGHSGDANRVSIAREKRAKREKSLPSRIWSNVLLATVGYGYKNWLAGVWLIGLILFGWLAFALVFDSQSDFSVLRGTPPGFDPLLYSVDVTVPFVDFNQQTYWSPNGWAALTCLVLTVGGYALATAVLAAATGLLGRDDR